MRRKTWIWIIIVALFAGSCGEMGDPEESTPAVESDSSEKDDGKVDIYAYPTPDPGPRFFPAPQEDFFPDNDGIVTLNPDPSKRKPLILRDNVYWLDDDHARTLLEYRADKLSFPLEGNEEMLGYRPGHIILNKYWEMRHEILRVRVERGMIIWETQIAPPKKAIKLGHLYIHVKPGTDWPVGFDAIDPYLYESRQEQIEEIVSRYLDSPQIKNHMEMAMADHPEFFQNKAVIEANQEGLRTKKQSLVINNCPENPLTGDALCTMDCSVIPEAYSDSGGESESSPDILNCIQDVTENIEHYRAVSPTSTTQGDEACIDAGKATTVCDTPDNCDQACACRKGLSVNDCANFVCEKICGYESAGDGESEEPDGFGGALSVCINPDTHPDADDPSSPHAEEKRCPGDAALKFYPKARCAPDVADGCEITLDNLPGSTSPAELSFRPILNLTLGFKASLDFYFIGADFTLGLYTGIGYGANAELRIGDDNGELAAVDGEWTLGEITGSNMPIFQFYVFFVRIGVDPILRVKAYAQANIGGKVGYEYYDEKWFYVCLFAEAGTGGVDAGIKVGDDAKSKCNLPDHDRDAKFDGFYKDDEFVLEISAGVAVGMGVQITAQVPGINTGGFINFYPIELRANLVFNLLAPRCWGEFKFSFGGSLKAGIILIKLLGFEVGFDWEDSWDYPGLAYYFNFVIKGEPWESLLGCGVYPEAEPEDRATTDCPFQPDPDDLDGNCTAELGEEARCFLNECVAQGAGRFSLGWQTVHDLDLYVRGPGGTVYSRGTTPGQFTRESCGSTCGMESSNRFIENLTLDSLPDGEYTVWVSLNSSMNDAASIPFSVELETTGADATRQTIDGEILQNQTESPTSFAFCVGDDPAKCPNVL